MQTSYTPIYIEELKNNDDIQLVKDIRDGHNLDLIDLNRLMCITSWLAAKEVAWMYNNYPEFSDQTKDDKSYWKHIFSKHFSAIDIYDFDYQKEYLEYADVENNLVKIDNIVSKNYYILFEQLLISKNKKIIDHIINRFNYLFRCAYLEQADEVLVSLVKLIDDLNVDIRTAVIRIAGRDFIEFADIQMIEYCLSVGFNILENPELNILSVLSSNSLDVVRYCHSLGLEYLHKHFIIVVKSCDISIIRFFIEELKFKSSANENEAIYHAAQRGDIEIFKYLTQNGYNVNKSNILEGAIRGCNKHIIRSVLAKRPNVSLDNSSALSMAVDTDDLDLVKHLISLGCKLDDDPELIVLAATNGNIQMLEYLVSQGMNIQVNNRRALMKAITAGRKEMVEFLVRRELYDEDTINTAIKIAISVHEVDILKYLIEDSLKNNKNRVLANLNSLKSSCEEIRNYLSTFSN